MRKSGVIMLLLMCFLISSSVVAEDHVSSKADELLITSLPRELEMGMPMEIPTEITISVKEVSFSNNESIRMLLPEEQFSSGSFPLLCFSQILLEHNNLDILYYSPIALGNKNRMVGGVAEVSFCRILARLSV